MKMNYSCEICGFNYQKIFGNEFYKCLEVHHVNPFAERDNIKVTKIEELILICPNCHRAIHSVKPALKAEEYRNIMSNSKI
jgi:5-methylcytosine-specific restriction protein A